MIDNKLSIYIHIPFCKQKCYYCDFLSAPGTDEEIEQYVNELIQTIKKEAVKYQKHEIYSIFIGGGTPSILSANMVQDILTTIREYYKITDSDHPFTGMELTIEVNPGTVDKQKLEAYYQMGINRISIGLQSTSNRELQNIGRIHTYEEFLETYQNVLDVGFENINIDIMTALPDQTEQSYEETVRKVCELKPQHISAYSLIIEENTLFYQIYEEETIESKGQLPDEDMERNMYLKTEEILNEYGYERYEISNYSKKGYECKHNQVYWTRGNYVGFGSGGASMVDNIRWSNYGESPHLLSKEEQMSEFMILGLRRMKGISKKEFMTLFRVSIEDKYGKELKKLSVEELIIYQKQNDRIILSKRGIDLSNYVFLEFFNK